MRRCSEARDAKLSTFASLRLPNFRLFIAGQLVAYTGTWVQRVAQDWLVLSITDSVTAVGITSGLQSVPIVVFGPLGGLLADRFSKRRVLLAAQVASAAIAIVLAVLTFADLVQVWHVYLAALGTGAAFSVESPARSSFVNELAGPTLLRNAVSINASVIYLGGLLGPAIGAALINAVGFGGAFALNAVSYGAPVTALVRLRRYEPGDASRPTGQSPRLRESLSYVVGRSAILWPTVLFGVFGMFTVNFATTLAAYARTIFHSGAGGYGLLNSMLAVGSLTGALISARLARTDMRTLLGAAFGLATVQTLATLAPTQAIFCIALIGFGVSFQLFATSVSTTVQLAAEDSIRGRVMGIFAVVYFGGGALGGPIVGWLDEHLGPRIGMLLGGFIQAFATALVGLKLARSTRPARDPDHLLRLRRRRGE